VQIYWWQRDGVYYVIRYAESGGRLDPLGRFCDLDAAIRARYAHHGRTNRVALTSDAPLEYQETTWPESSTNQCLSPAIRDDALSALGYDHSLRADVFAV
jgi:hypothetical protein